MYGKRWFFRPVGSDGDATGSERQAKESKKSSTRPQEVDFYKIIINEFLPHALTIGISYFDFWHMNPAILKAHVDAFIEKRKIMDEQMWVMGHYIMSALDATVCNNVLWRGKNGKPAKYIEKPIMQTVNNNNKVLTEEEKKRETEKFFMSLKIMEANFKANHKKEGEKNET